MAGVRDVPAGTAVSAKKVGQTLQARMRSPMRGYLPSLNILPNEETQSVKKASCEAAYRLMVAFPSTEKVLESELLAKLPGSLGAVGSKCCPRGLIVCPLAYSLATALSKTVRDESKLESCNPSAKYEACCSYRMRHPRSDPGRGDQGCIRLRTTCLAIPQVSNRDKPYDSHHARRRCYVRRRPALPSPV